MYQPSTTILCVAAFLSIGLAAHATSDDDAIALFQQYLKIRSDQPNPDYKSAAKWVRDQCTRLGLQVKEASYVEGKPVVICAVEGTNPDLPRLMANSHMDVVPPGDPAKWDWPAFDAVENDDGFVVARGAQDMKCVGVQYLLAVERLLSSGWQPDRTLYLTFVPDEEIGGHDGMGLFVASKDFAAMRVGAALDEGLPSPGAHFSLYYGERQTWWITMRAEAPPGHGATLPETTAVQTLLGALQKALEFRRGQWEAVRKGEKGRGEAIGVNIVALKAGTPNGKGGYIGNVIPRMAEAHLDLRVPPEVPEAEVDGLIADWMSCDGSPCAGLTHFFTQKVVNAKTTSLDERKSAWAARFKSAARELGLDLRDTMFPAATDARYIRAVDLPAFGFSPINGSAELLHKENEMLSREVFLRGVGIYEHLLSALCRADESGAGSADAPGDCEEEL